MMDGFFDFAWRKLEIMTLSALAQRDTYLLSKGHCIRTVKTELVKLVVFCKHVIHLTYSELIAKVRFDEDDLVDQLS